MQRKSQRRAPAYRLGRPRILAKAVTAGLVIGFASSTTGLAGKVQPPPEVVNLSCRYPVLAALPESPELQEKGGLQFVLTPYAYSCQRDTEVRRVDAIPKFKERLQAMVSFGNEAAPTRFVEQREIPVLRVTPDRLRFKVRIFNKLPRVFRGAGMVVQFIVGGKAQTVDQELYAGLVSSIVPPRSETEIELLGPPVADLPEVGTIGVLFYDVVTATDEAGNISEMQNFEWYFTYASQLVEDTGTVVSSRGWVSH